MPKTIQSVFYVKTRTSEGIEIIIPIENENVYTLCKSCGHEIKIPSFSDAIKKDSFDFYTKSIACPWCKK